VYNLITFKIIPTLPAKSETPPLLVKNIVILKASMTHLTKFNRESRFQLALEKNLIRSALAGSDPFTAANAVQ